MIDVDAIFRNRYSQFCARFPIFSLLIIKSIRLLWKEDEFKSFEKNNSNKKGLELITAGLNSFNFAVEISDADKAKIPTTGGLVVIANHPIGSLDGLALLKFLAEIRNDVKSLNNALLNSVTAMQCFIIPIDNLGGKTAKSTVKTIKNHLQSGGVLLIFPSGKVSRFYDGKIQDPPWFHGFYKFALDNNTPLLPVYIEAKNSIWFYFLSIVCFDLSTLWLVREMFKFKNKIIPMRFGNLIYPADLEAKYSTIEDKVDAVRKAVYALQKSRDKEPLPC